MRVLVTGGGGYIGSHCVRLLQQKNIDTSVFDNFERGDRRAVDCEVFDGDLLRPRNLDVALSSQRFDAVLHFAALIIVEESVAEPERYLQTNTVGTLNLLEAMRRHGCTNLIFSSTAAVYGDPESVPIPETHRLKPINPYGLSKLLAEQIIAYHGEMHGLKWVAFRYFNAAGREFPFPAEHFRKEDTHVVTRILNAAEDDSKTLQIYGKDYETVDGTCVRDYVHVTDIASAHILALDYLQKKNPSNVFNIGSGSGYSVQQVIEECRARTGRRIRTEQGPRRAGDPPVLVASNERIKSVLGWKPKYNTLQSIVESAWAWHHEPKLHAAPAL